MRWKIHKPKPRLGGTGCAMDLVHDSENCTLCRRIEKADIKHPKLCVKKYPGKD